MSDPTLSNIDFRNGLSLNNPQKYQCNLYLFINKIFFFGAGKSYFAMISKLKTIIYSLYSIYYTV